MKETFFYGFYSIFIILCIIYFEIWLWFYARFGVKSIGHKDSCVHICGNAFQKDITIIQICLNYAFYFPAQSPPFSAKKCQVMRYRTSNLHKTLFLKSFYFHKFSYDPEICPYCSNNCIYEDTFEKKKKFAAHCRTNSIPQSKHINIRTMESGV